MRLPSRSSLLRPVALSAALIVACAPSTPTASEPPTATPTATPAPTVARPPVKARSVSTVGGSLVATGDFVGAGGTQIAVIDDPKRDLALRITVRDAFTANGVADVWLDGAVRLAIARTKLAVADVDVDGKDDLVALYDGGANVSRLFVFRSSGTSFSFGGEWWSGEYAWSRARSIVSGRFSGGARDSLLVAYADDDARMRVFVFETTGTQLILAGTAYDSGPGQFDLARTRFAVGRFTRSSGADQLVALGQAGAHAKLVVFDPSPSGLVRTDVFETDVDYDVTHAVIRAADVVGDARDEVVTLYVDAKGGARVYVFDPADGFRPLNGWTGWTAVPDGAVCGGPGALAVGDWDADKRADIAALAPAAGGAVRAHLLTTRGTGATLASTTDDGLVCPVWPLSGLPLGFGDATVRPIYVKIDNNPSARPHYGISQADMVYEWLVEGLTTRLAAVFQSQRPGELGSVRSVRMTDRHVLPSLGAVLVYSGGGPEELMAINYDASVAHRYIDLSPSYGWGYRVSSRVSPYNYFTSYDAVRSAIAAAPEGEQPAIVAPWRFLPTSSGDPLAGGFAASIPATNVTIPYRALFGVSYTYDAGTRTYARFDDGAREVDAANGVAIAARNVVVIQTEVRFTTEFGLDPAGNPKLHEVLTGSGKGVVFRDGRRMDVVWTRADVTDAFTLQDANGAPVLLSPGQTWVHVVPDDWTIPSE